MIDICACAVAASSRMLIGGLSAILRKRKDSKKKRKNKHKGQKKQLDERRRKIQNKQEEGKNLNAHAQSWAILSPKMSVLPSFFDFSSCVGWPKPYTQAPAKILLRHFHFSQYRFFDRGQRWERTVRCASRSTVSLRTSKVYLVSCTTFFPKKKNPMVIRKIQEPSERERFLQEEATGELDRKRWQKMSELHCFQHCKVYEQGRGPVRPVWMPRL